MTLSFMVTQVESRVSNVATKQTGRFKLPEWLDEDFLQLCMQRGENDPTIRVLKHSVTIGSISSYPNAVSTYRVSVEFKRRPRSRNILDFKPQEVRSLIIKVMNHDNQDSKSLDTIYLIEKEIELLSKTIPAIHKIVSMEYPQSGIQQFTSHCIYSELQPRPLIVVEDLHNLGYCIASPKGHRGLDLEHSTMVMRVLATFHAGSIAIYEKDPSSMKHYEANVWNKQNESLVKDFIELTVKDVADEVATWPGYGEKYSAKIRGLRKNLLSRVNAAVTRDPESFNVLVHGDLWFNNILFKYDMTGTGISDLMFVNFSNARYSSPVIDLQHFLFSSPVDEVRSKNYTRLLRVYYESLVYVMGKFKVNTKPPTFEELTKEMTKRGSYGILIAFILLPIVLGEKTLNHNFLNNPDVIKSRRKFYSTENYRSALKRLLPIFEERGLFD
ncbi:uncharacterized protein LOC107270730 [Cephus cinctus]|uniref:Uncharacterized protein LOC107270730 n=1 Tax=Cephus cinctus TaxID=211228 RepID=A0AAJ7FP88_CEPCN|nr:uncharacterized protein LOC107270730 [Cephus cinctus]